MRAAVGEQCACAERLFGREKKEGAISSGFHRWRIPMKSLISFQYAEFFAHLDEGGNATVEMFAVVSG